MNDIEESIRNRIEDCPRTGDRYISEINAFDGDGEVFVEVSFNNIDDGNAKVHYPRQSAIGAFEASDEDVVNVCVMLQHTVARITLDEEHRDMSEDELRGRIPHLLKFA